MNIKIWDSTTCFFFSMIPGNYSIDTFPEFDNHSIVSFISDPDTRLSAFVAIHRGGIKKPTFGATRLWEYVSNEYALRDALKLSKIMTYKSALAGLHHGGAKAVIMRPKGDFDRTALLQAYAKHIDYLGGHLITGSDVGISMDDLRVMAKNSKYMIGLHSNPVVFTMLGVFLGIRVCLDEIFGSDSISGRTFAVQGLGKTGTELLTHIYNNAKNIYVSDINQDAVKAVKDRFPRVEAVPPGQIAFMDVDVFSPCAMSNVINHDSVTNIRAKIIAGCANSQLENDAMGELLYKKGILYAPDYVINAGGLMAVVDEYEQKNHDPARVTRKVHEITGTLASIFGKSRKTKQPPNLIADALARQISLSFI